MSILIKAPFLDEFKKFVHEKTFVDDEKFPELVERIHSRIQFTEDCWFWTGNQNPKGYGLIFFKHSSFLAHRVMYTLHKGEIPEELVIDHLCRTRNCVNPSHLRTLSAVENTMIGEGPTAQNKRKKFCPRNHPYSGENVFPTCDGKGRRCRICTNSWNRKYYHDKKKELEKIQPN